MWTSLLAPFVVVLFVAILFALTVILVSATAHGHDDEWETLEAATDGQVEVTATAVHEPVGAA